MFPFSFFTGQRRGTRNQVPLLLPHPDRVERKKREKKPQLPSRAIEERRRARVTARYLLDHQLLKRAINPAFPSFHH
jgi:hypothetical protein